MKHDRGDFARALEAAGRGFGGDEAAWLRFLKGLSEPVRRRLFEEWAWQAHGGQKEPPPLAGSGPGKWRVWLIMAGRGFGKTRAGAEWVSARAREHPGASIALVGANRDDIAKVMVEGPSGLLAVRRTGEELVWVPTQGVVRFGNGAEAFVYSAAAPGKLRGPEHHFAWCDELAKWRRADESWDNLQMGMRLGDRPRMIVTTTPKTVPILRRVREGEGVVETGGSTAENAHLLAAYQAWAAATYGGTRIGRQELEGQLIEDVAGALFPRELIERARVRAPLARELKRIVVGVDPPASVGGTCGIVVCGVDGEGVPCVLDDRSVSGASPPEWARAVARAAAAWEAELVIAEKNQGGDMVSDVLKGANSALPIRLVSASRGKSARAEPVAMAFEAGEARIAGRFALLEDELAGLTYAGGYEGPTRSPDRADACVWALSELMRPEARPAVRAL